MNEEAERIYNQSKRITSVEELQKAQQRLNFLGAWDYAAEVGNRMPKCSCLQYQGDNPECYWHGERKGKL